MGDLISHQIDNYRIDALLGEGGMGAVYRALDLNLERTVALKVMHGHLARQPEFQRRFLQEARAAARLDHASIVKIHHFGRSQGLLYMVMAFVPGGSLAAHVRRLQQTDEVVPLREILSLLAQVADALGYAHKHEVIHRDVKPSNVLVQRLEEPEREGDPPLRAIVTDFGLAKLLTGGVETQTDTLIGTYPYMSPEQCLREEIDIRSDIYSLGVMLYLLTTGKLPLDIQSATDAVLKHQRNEVPPAPRAVWPGLPGTVEAIILKAIAKRPADRLQKAETMALALREAAKMLTDSDLTRFTQQRTAVSLVTHLQSKEVVSKPSDMGEDLSPFPQGDRLVIAQKEHTAYSVPLDKAQLTLGRSKENEVPLPHEDVSRRHARLERTSSGWQVVDLGSTNGTFLEGARLLPDVPEDINPGQILRIGPYFIHWQKAGEASRSIMIPGPKESNVRALTSGMTRVHSSSGQISVDVNPTNLEVAPGGRADVQVDLFNQGVTVDHFSLRVEGLPEAWVTLPREAVELMPGADASLPFTIHPPRDSSARAGSHPYRLIVSSTSNPGERASIPGQVTVTRLDEFSVDLQPSSLVSGAVSRVTIRNQGNAEEVYSVVGQDPAEAIQFEGERGRIKIAPGKSETLALEVAAKRRPFLGRNKILPFEVQVRSATGAREKQTGQLEVRPFVPGWIPPLLGLLLTLCVAGSILLAPSFTRAPTPTPTYTLILTSTSIPMQLSPTLTPTGPSPRSTRTDRPTATPTPTRTPTPSYTPTHTPTTPPPTTLPPPTNPPPRIGDGKIAFVSNRNENDEVYVMAADGSRLTRLTNSPGFDYNPAWSPDGSRIVFESARNSGIGMELYLMNADGSGQTRLTNNQDFDHEPAWSPDGSRIAYHSSRDGNSDIYVMNADGSRQTRLTHDLAQDVMPAWSPDGTRIAFVSNRDGNREIYMMNVDGSRQIRLTNNLADDIYPAWSPDGSQIAFSSNRNGNHKIYVMNSNGSNLKNLTNNRASDSEPAWSPDGTWIAFVSSRDGNFEIYVMNADGSGQTRLTDSPGFDFMPAWHMD